MAKKIIFFILCMMLLSRSSFATETIAIVCEQACPYACIDQKTGKPAKQPGIAMEIAKAVFEPLGYQITLDFRPAARAVKATRNGKFTAYVTVKEAAPDFIYPEHEVLMAKVCFFVKKGNPWRYEGIDSLSSVRIGCTASYHFGDSLQEYIEKHKQTDAVQLIWGEDAVETNIKKLLVGRIDTFIDEANIVLYIIKQKNLSQSVQIAGCVTDWKYPVYLCFSPALPQSKKYVRILSNGIKKLKESGQLQTIYHKYGLVD